MSNSSYWQRGGDDRYLRDAGRTRTTTAKPMTAKQIRDLRQFATELAAAGRHSAAAEVLALIGTAK